MGTFSSDLQNRIRTNLDRKMASTLDLSKLSINRATIILNSIGSLSKMKGSSWTFKRSQSHEGSVSDPGLSSSPPLAEGFSRLPSSKPAPLLSATSAQSAKCLQSASRSRRKSAHTVLLEDDSSDEPHTQRGEAWKEKKNYFKKKYIYIYYLSVTAGAVEDGQRVRGRKRRRLYKSDSEGFSSPLLHGNAGRRPLDEKPFPVGIRTIGSFHGAMTNSRLNPHLLHATTSSAPVHKRDVQMVHRVQGMTHGSISTFRQQKAIRGCLMAPRGRRRAHSSPAFSPLVVGGENYDLASPSVRVCTEDRGRVQFNRFQRIPR